jgi:hypothetical protein
LEDQIQAEKGQFFSTHRIDHGGVGIDEFRTVEKNVCKWLGGGKINQNDSNVYDVLIMN